MRHAVSFIPNRDRRVARASIHIDDSARPLSTWAPQTLRTVLALAMSPSQWSAALAELGAECSDGERRALVLDLLVQQAQSRPANAALIAARLSLRLDALAVGFSRRSFLDHAAAWTRVRQRAQGDLIAALLASVAAEPAYVYRRLEDVIVADVAIGGLRALAERDVAHGCTGI